MLFGTKKISFEFGTLAKDAVKLFIFDGIKSLYPGGSVHAKKNCDHPILIECKDK